MIKHSIAVAAIAVLAQPALSSTIVKQTSFSWDYYSADRNINFCTQLQNGVCGPQPPVVNPDNGGFFKVSTLKAHLLTFGETGFVGPNALDGQSLRIDWGSTNEDRWDYVEWKDNKGDGWGFDLTFGTDGDILAWSGDWRNADFNVAEFYSSTQGSRFPSYDDRTQNGMFWEGTSRSGFWELTSVSTSCTKDGRSTACSLVGPPLAAIPLPASFGFLIGGLGFLGGLSLRKGRLS